MKYLEFDLRALALMRICLAFVILLDLSIRLSDLEAFYTNQGAMPLSMIHEYVWNEYFISFHAISGKWWVQFALFMVSAFCALMLLIGYRTRLFTVLSWLMMVSLHNRAELILQGGDDLLRTVLFWCMFIPWGARYSCDSLLKEADNETFRIRTPATIAYMLQIMYVYTGSAMLKGAEWHTDFTALYYVYSLDQISYPVTEYIFQHPDLMKVLTAIAWYFELLGPLLFFIPFKHQFFRVLAIVLIIGFHSFNASTVFIGLFPLIGIATCLGMVPSGIMDKFDRLTARIQTSVASSFLGIAYPVKTVIPVKRTATFNPARRNTGISLVVITLTGYVFYWNLSNLKEFPYKMPGEARFAAYMVRIDQCWGMFSPGVFKDDGWYILEGETEDGQLIDLAQEGRPVTYTKPESVVSIFKNDRWRKYSENMLMTSNDYMRGYFCNYTKRVWNEEHPEQKIKALRVIYMLEVSKPDYQLSQPAKEVLFECLD
ncbi:MAG TPA: HTTM domain-containing protein [Bacteroidia bacterium]|nr:HTTM domain-containing protein [Bacteroidia bacterium]